MYDGWCVHPLKLAWAGGERGKWGVIPLMSAVHLRMRKQVVHNQDVGAQGAREAAQDQPARVRVAVSDGAVQGSRNLVPAHCRRHERLVISLVIYGSSPDSFG